MSWEYRDTDCKQNCPDNPTCTYKSKKECEHYDPIHIDKRYKLSFLSGICLILKVLEDRSE